MQHAGSPLWVCVPCPGACTAHLLVCWNGWITGLMVAVATTWQTGALQYWPHSPEHEGPTAIWHACGGTANSGHHGLCHLAALEPCCPGALACWWPAHGPSRDAAAWVAAGLQCAECKEGGCFLPAVVLVHVPVCNVTPVPHAQVLYASILSIGTGVLTPKGHAGLQSTYIPPHACLHLL